MNDSKSGNGEALRAKIADEMADSLDEELELEIDDDRLDKLLSETGEQPDRDTLDRRIYFKELFRMQGELVKLQDWVQHHKKKIVVIF
jgi:polyphosphate kinase 2 (PPK2 family)